jgi:hypothetical protein
MERLGGVLQDMREQLRQGMDAVAAQSRANGEALLRLAESQTARRELCARQEARLTAQEREGGRHRKEHASEREEYLAERADIWAAVNKLRFHVYVGLGAGLVLQILAPLVLRAALK